MKSPKGGHGERKDKTYFSQEIEKLFDEAESNGQPEIALILGVLAGAIAANNTRELSKLCAEFAKQEIERIEKYKKTPKN